MPAAETGQANTGLASPVVFGAGLLMLGLSPIIRGGNRHVALVLLEWLALLLLVALLARGLAFRDRADAQPSQPLASAGVWVLALSPLWVALVQLIPLPVSLWAALPGHAPYAEALAVAQAPAAAFRPLSLTPDITLVSVLAGLPLSAAFLLAFYSSFRQIGLLVHALVGLAVAQAVLGLLQMGPFPGLSFGSAIGGRAIGTFANPNHFASYIAMTLPLAILLLRPAMVSARGTMRGGPRGGRPMGALWGVALFLLLAAVLASGSRGGTVTCLVVTLLAVLLLPQREWSSARTPALGHGRHGRLAGVGGTGRRCGCAAGPLRGATRRGTSRATAGPMSPAPVADLSALKAGRRVVPSAPGRSRGWRAWSAPRPASASRCCSTCWAARRGSVCPITSSRRWRPEAHLAPARAIAAPAGCRSPAGRPDPRHLPASAGTGCRSISGVCVTSRNGAVRYLRLKSKVVRKRGARTLASLR
jgi:uncharacterized membrane protein